MTNDVSLSALIRALPILAACLDDPTKAKIKALVEKQEKELLEAMGEHPAAELMKEQHKTIRFLLNVK
ncbi:hypothetical protein KKJ12_14935 [Xenorhabdus bovienii]|uniref:hypothetical protein n=1 Tax=Xenorhabdus bovienii TaxID=40576 RepID=UPI0023B30286|nr:hypothetical protein [Xenorhabdus bovienii]MDE9474183.1 hypothetical protein [Xenorhabdus bovienii]